MAFEFICTVCKQKCPSKVGPGGSIITSALSVYEYEDESKEKYSIKDYCYKCADKLGLIPKNEEEEENEIEEEN